MRTEARITDDNLLVILSPLNENQWSKDFCGSVVEFADVPQNLTGRNVYLCGDLTVAKDLDFGAAKRVAVIEDYSRGTLDQPHLRINLGQVPMSVHGVGVFFKQLFDPSGNYFNRICSEHSFQSLTESNKPGKAHRTGVYLTPVKKVRDELHFRLLRCSTNLSGPTENFGATDTQIVKELNNEAGCLFESHAAMNHVLAQVYHNTPASETRKQTKAKIQSHADKTKDMPDNGIMAFCTFYDGIDKLNPMPDDSFDFGLKKTSGLTRLQFKIKNPRSDGSLPDDFVVPLYPGSVFLMPLSTNRLYTHQTRPGTLDAENLPTRLGYVVRCSSAEAVHKYGKTCLKIEGSEVELEQPTAEGMDELRQLYAEENRSENFIDYGNRFLFSMNTGDYKPPRYQSEDEFRAYQLTNQGNLFDTLIASVSFEQMGKGRQGTVLVRPDDARGTPVVRTTTDYAQPAQCFRDCHCQLAQQIEKLVSAPFSFNNALVETYTNEYRKMGFHSDQALDLEDGSAIVLFSCYRNPELTGHERRLVVEPKDPNQAKFDVELPHNSVIVFSVDANRVSGTKLCCPTFRPIRKMIGWASRFEHRRRLCSTWMTKPHWKLVKS